MSYITQPKSIQDYEQDAPFEAAMKAFNDIRFMTGRDMAEWIQDLRNFWDEWDEAGRPVTDDYQETESDRVAERSLEDLAERIPF